ncbi:S-methyl-5-thioadenosine phosphorylase [Xylographa pallens]|nr:S-methyl-5-thioadenosine phosphorylase [Xylographa pallens]
MAELPDHFEGAVPIAIIGGTGLSHLPSFTPVARLPLSHPSLLTPWGAPSSPITILSHPRRAPSSTTNLPPSPPLNVAFLSRHGLHHELAPHEVPSRANIAALRKLGVRCVVAFSAVGSLREEVRPRDFVVPDQVIDRTKGVRPWTYFEGGVVGHIGFADPFDNALRAIIIEAIQGKSVLEGEDIKLHESGTLICMGPSPPPQHSPPPSYFQPPSHLPPPAPSLSHPKELPHRPPPPTNPPPPTEGPQFSTRAESLLYRSWNGACINMSCLPEAKLAREAELAYAMICMSTDYDSWHAVNETVSVEMVMGHMAANAQNAKRVVAAVLDRLGEAEEEEEGGEKAGQRETVGDVVRGRRWEGQTKGAGAMTARGQRPEETVRKLRWLFPDYF